MEAYTLQWWFGSRFFRINEKLDGSRIGENIIRRMELLVERMVRGIIGF